MTHSCNLAKGTSSDLPYFATSFHIELNNSCRSTKLCSCQEHKQEPIHNFVYQKNNGLKYFLKDHSKVNSVQEACVKCFEVHVLEFEILPII